VRNVAAAFDEVAGRHDLMVALNPGYHRHLRAAADALMEWLPRPRLARGGPPVALLERVAKTPFLAASQLLHVYGVAGHDLWTVPIADVPSSRALCIASSWRAESGGRLVAVRPRGVRLSLLDPVAGGGRTAGAEFVCIDSGVITCTDLHQ
jgi:hypothetical protein